MRLDFLDHGTLSSVGRRCMSRCDGGNDTNQIASRKVLEKRISVAAAASIFELATNMLAGFSSAKTNEVKARFRRGLWISLTLCWRCVDAISTSKTRSTVVYLRSMRR